MHRTSVGSKNRAYCLSLALSDSQVRTTPENFASISRDILFRKCWEWYEKVRWLSRDRIILCFCKMNVLWRLKSHVLCKCRVIEGEGERRSSRFKTDMLEVAVVSTYLMFALFHSSFECNPLDKLQDSGTKLGFLSLQPFPSFFCTLKL